MPAPRQCALLLGLCFLSLEVAAQAYYLCLDPKTGKKIGQDTSCAPGKEIGAYAPVSPAELKAREEASRQSKREFERSHPGTYAPEEYMTAEELAAYREKAKEREAERRRLEDEARIREATRRAAEAERRAGEAERTAREARERAVAAEEEAARRPNLLIVPRRLPEPQRLPGPRRDERRDHY